MIKLSELQPGDIVMVDYEGQVREGVVKELDHAEKLVGVETEVQEFWYAPDHIYPIPLDDSQLMKLGFSKEVSADGAVKYKKNSFRVLIAREGDFSQLEIWWREDRRFLRKPINVHELQNHYYQMTKVELNPA